MVRLLRLPTITAFLFFAQVSRAGEVLIDSAHHALGDTLRAVEQLPADALPSPPAPVCIVVHGSGGLFKENLPGEVCSAELESNFPGQSSFLPTDLRRRL